MIPAEIAELVDLSREEILAKLAERLTSATPEEWTRALPAIEAVFGGQDRSWDEWLDFSSGSAATPGAKPYWEVLKDLYGRDRG